MSKNNVPSAETHLLYTMSKQSVAVEVFLVTDETGQATIVATFSPTDPTLHLYGITLPRAGIQGAGRPTLVEVIAGPLQTAGSLTADAVATPYELPGFEAPFPLYPDGPVTLTLPVKLPATRPSTLETELSVTYMACSSEGVCKPPVTDHRFMVALPTTLWPE